MSDDIGADAREAGFVGRWSRRKLAAREQRGPDDADVDGGAVAEVSADGVCGEAAGDAFEQAAPVLTDADMPDLDSLAEDASYADFLSPGVSDELRRRALRKLFHSAAFNVRDGLNDYDGDFTQFEKLGDIVTADMKHRMEMEAERMQREALDSLDAESDDVVAVAPSVDCPGESAGGDGADAVNPDADPADGLDSAAVPHADDENRKPADDQ